MFPDNNANSGAAVAQLALQQLQKTQMSTTVVHNAAMHGQTSASMAGYQYDATSGLYFEPNSRLYYDPKTQVRFSISHGRLLLINF